MTETTTSTDSAVGTGFRGNLQLTRTLLRLVYAGVPIVAGLDKFTNVLVVWTDYLPGAIAGLLPVDPATFMAVVGLVEIVAGIVVLTRYVEYGAYLVAGWLVAIAATQIVAGNYDIAVRDVVMAVGAVALAQLTAAERLGDRT